MLQLRDSVYRVAPMQSPIQPRSYISDCLLQPASKSGATQPVVILPGGWQIVLPGVAHYCIGMHTYTPLQVYTCILLYSILQIKY